MMMETPSTVGTILLAAFIVGVGHFAISGVADAVLSAQFGIAGGFGALVLDILRAYRESSHGSHGDDANHREAGGRAR